MIQFRNTRKSTLHKGVVIHVQYSAEATVRASHSHNFLCVSQKERESETEERESNIFYLMKRNVMIRAICKREEKIM